MTNKGASKFTTLAPGRVNLLGEHIDYNDGIVMPVAIDRYVHLECQPIDEPVIQLTAADYSRSVIIPLHSLDDKVDIDGKPLPSFALYPAGVASALQKEGFEVPGLNVVLTSNIPIGSGLSSSAAVEVGFAVSWQHLANYPVSKMRLAQLCQNAESLYVGVNSGLMDQFASMFGIADHILVFDTRDLSWRPLPLPEGTTMVVADSSVRRSLAGSAYNERRRDCQEALTTLKKYIPGISSLRDISPEQFHQYAQLLDRNPRFRAWHVVDECARVTHAISILEKGGAEAFGHLMANCHSSLRDHYEVSCPELDALVEIASTQPGCYGAKLTGAGFGGCTVNLVKTDAVEAFIKNLSSQYQTLTGKVAKVYRCQAANGATVLEQ
jgi:galactokinase